MKLYLIKKKATYDLSNVVTSITWSGSLEQASRSVEFSVCNAPLDTNLKSLPNIATGDFIRLKESGETLFFGMIYVTERTSQVGEVAYTAYDLLYHFTKSSWCRSFKNKTAEAITREFMVVEAMAEPNLKDKDLQEHFGVKTPKDLAFKLFQGGDLAAIANAITELSGYGQSSVVEIKN